MHVNRHLCSQVLPSFAPCRFAILVLSLFSRSCPPPLRPQTVPDIVLARVFVYLFSVPGSELTAENLSAVASATKNELPGYYPTLFAAMLEKSGGCEQFCKMSAGGKLRVHACFGTPSFNGVSFSWERSKGLCTSPMAKPRRLSKSLVGWKFCCRLKTPQKGVPSLKASVVFDGCISQALVICHPAVCTIPQTC